MDGNVACNEHYSVMGVVEIQTAVITKDCQYSSGSEIYCSY